MPTRKIDRPEVQAWVTSLSAPKRLQYAPSVRGFLASRQSPDLSSVTTAELVDFVTRTTTASTEPKTISALKHFFGAITEDRTITIDPARSLNKAVKHARAATALRSQLEKAGLSAQEVLELSWRDLVPLTLGRAEPVPDISLTDEVRADLTDALLARLRTTASAADLDAVLDAPLLEFVSS